MLQKSGASVIPIKSYATINILEVYALFIDIIISPHISMPVPFSITVHFVAIYGMLMVAYWSCLPQSQSEVLCVGTKLGVDVMSICNS